MAKQARFQNTVYPVWKRLFDVVFANIALVLYAPVLVIVALAIKAESPGPVFSRQVRLGRHGKLFRYLKFRTMIVDASATATGPVFALRSDPRITRVGRFLRRTALDELPVLLNVLKGDMSIVGPRAALPLEVEHYSEKERRRLEIKPGLTGYWQVFGREKGLFDFGRMVEMDLEYAAKCSLMLDLRILLRSIAMAFANRAAY